MAIVRVQQRNAHLAGSAKLEYVNGREGKAASIPWTLWGKQAENAADDLGKVTRVARVPATNSSNSNNSTHGREAHSQARDLIPARLFLTGWLVLAVPSHPIEDSIGLRPPGTLRPADFQ